MNFADTAMTGQYNAEDMAAVAVAGSRVGSCGTPGHWLPVGAAAAQRADGGRGAARGSGASFCARAFG